MRDMLFIFSWKFIEGFGYDRKEYCCGFSHVEKVNCCGCLISLLYLRYERHGRNRMWSVSMVIFSIFLHTSHELYLAILTCQSFIFQLKTHATINHINKLSNSVNTLHPWKRMSQTLYDTILLTTTTTTTKCHIFSSPVYHKWKQQRLPPFNIDRTTD